MEVYPLEKSCTIEVGSRKVQFTMIDANHSPGSVMFLFEHDGTAVLYTGDIRAEKWYVNSLLRNPSVVPFLKGCGSKRLANIYADTTFAKRLDGTSDPHYIDIQSNFDGIQTLLKSLEKYPKNTQFRFKNTSTLGFEDVWIMLYHKYGERIYVGGNHWKIFEAIAPHCHWGRELLKCLTNDPRSSRFHGCGCARHCTCWNIHTVDIVPVIDKTSTEVQQDAEPIPLNNEHMVKFTDEPPYPVFKNESPQPHYTVVTPRTNFKYILSANNDCYVRTTVEFHHSRHSSKDEISHLVSIFHPQTVHPFTATMDHYLKGFRMHRIFGHVCESPSFKYDLDMVQLTQTNPKFAFQKDMLDNHRDFLDAAAVERKKQRLQIKEEFNSDQETSGDDSDNEDIHKLMYNNAKKTRMELDTATKKHDAEVKNNSASEGRKVLSQKTKNHPSPSLRTKSADEVTPKKVRKTATTITYPGVAIKKEKSVTISADDYDLNKIEKVRELVATDENAWFDMRFDYRV